MRVCGSQNFKIKKRKSAVSSQEKLENFIFEVTKFKIAGKMCLYARLMIPKWIWEFFIFKAVFVNFCFSSILL